MEKIPNYGEKREKGREQEGEQLLSPTMEDDWRREQIKGRGGEEREMGERIGWGSIVTRPAIEHDQWR